MKWFYYLVFLGFLYGLGGLLALSTLFTTFILGPVIKALFSMKERRAVDMFKPEEPFFESFSWLLEQLTAWGLWGSVAVIPVLFLGVGGLRFFLQVVHVWGWEWLAERECLQQRKHLMLAFLSQSSHRGFFYDQKTKMTQKMSALFSIHMDHYKQYLVTVRGDFPYQVIQAVLLVVMMFFIAPYLTLGMILGVIPLLVSGSYFTKKITQRRQQELDILSLLSGWVEGCFSAVATIKHHKSEAYEVTRFREKLDDLLRKQIRTKRTLAQSSPVGELISFVVLCLVFYVGLRYRETLSLGVASLVSYISSLVFLSQNINKITKMVGVWGSGKAALKQISEAKTQWQQAVSDELKVEFLEPHESLCLEAQKVSFSYEGAPLIKGFSQKFYYGKIYAVVGKSGVGKSTLLKILTAALSPSCGKLTYYKNPLVNPQHIPSLPLVYMPQDFAQIPMSVAEGVAFPHQDVNRQRVKQALRESQVWDVLEEKGLSLDSVLGVAASPLSGGELQRISLARIFYHRPSLVVADELSSALDFATERSILKKLQELSYEGACVITVAHRREVMELADEVITLAAE